MLSTVVLLLTYLGRGDGRRLLRRGRRGWPRTPTTRRRCSRCSPPRRWAAGTGSCCSPSRRRPSRPPRRRSSPRPAPACRWRGGRRCPGGSPPSRPRTARPTSPPGGSPASGVAWYVGVGLVSENALYDSITGLSLLIALYYALTGLACAVLFRRRLLRSVRNFLLLGVGPLAGAAMLAWLLVLSVRDLADAGQLLHRPGVARASGRRWSSGWACCSPACVLMLWWRGGTRRSGASGSDARLGEHLHQRGDPLRARRVGGGGVHPPQDGVPVGAVERLELRPSRPGAPPARPRGHRAR